MFTSTEALATASTVTSAIRQRRASLPALPIPITRASCRQPASAIVATETGELLGR